MEGRFAHIAQVRSLIASKKGNEQTNVLEIGDNKTGKIREGRWQRRTAM